MKRKLIAGCILLLMLAGAARLSLKQLTAHQERNMMATARASLAKNDLRGAYLSAQQARQINPKNPKASEILAKVAERQNSPAAILYYTDLANLCPDSAEIALKLAQTAAGFGETAVAQQALARLTEPARNTVAYHEVAAACAIQEKSLAEAEGHFQKALALASTGSESNVLRLNLATLQLGMGEEEKADKARKTLETLSTDPLFRQSGTRALLADARLRKDTKRAIKLAADLRSSATAGLQDELSYLETIQFEEPSLFDNELSNLMKKAETDSGAAYVILTWMSAHGLALNSLTWFARMPASLRVQPQVKLAVADAYVAALDWDALREFTGSGVQGGWEALDFLRLAYRARAVVGSGGERQRKKSATAQEWESAIIATAGNRDMLCMLARLANGWGWRTESAQAWWLVARQPAGQQIALKELFKMASGSKDAAELYRVARRIYQVDPGNPAARNNVAMLALLLGEDVMEAHAIAAELYKSFPASPGIASTHAFSLYLQGKSAQAASIMASLPEPALRQPSLAACYGVILAAEGRREAARPYLETAMEQRSELFSQEINLVINALDQER